jgi:PKD repeat protein
MTTKQKQTNIRLRAKMFLLTGAILLGAMPILAPAAHADFLGCVAGGERVDICLAQNKQTSTSFTEFTGGLEAPSTAGYNAGLVQATNARQYILNVTNFALGFLGLLAVVIVIYGGVLYLTAAGEASKADKGKKSISYAVIGLIIIMGSYALVNTILKAPSGSEAENLSGAAPGGTATTAATAEAENARRRALFNIAAVQVDTIARDFVTAYQNYSQIQTAITELENIPTVSSAADLRTLLTNKKTVLEQIKTTAGPLSDINGKVQGALDVVNKYLQLNDQAIAAEARRETDWYAFWTDGSGKFQSELKNQTGEAGMTGANKNDFALAVASTKKSITDLQTRVGNSVTGLADVDAAFTAAMGQINAFISQTGTQKPTLIKVNVTNEDIRNILTAFANLSNVLSNVQFVYAVINADVKSGSAPLLVNFDGLKSLDPLNRNIPTGSFSWDFGDGQKATNVTTQHVFEATGTYIVKLQVTAPAAAANEAQVADGISYTTITVSEPKIKIDLQATVGNYTPALIFPLRKYDKVTGKLATDVNVVKVTPSEASEAGGGITFDATGTDPTKISSIRWNFGNETPEIIGDKNTVALTQKAVYPKAGTYRTILEITDIQGNTDRKIVNVIVGNPIARVKIIPSTNMNIREDFTANGEDSSSEGGQITDYSYTINTADGTTVASSADGIKDPNSFQVQATANTAEYKGSFLKPGPYTMNFQITDSLDRTDTTAVNFNVSSKPPVAQFTYKTQSPSQPGTIVLDGTQSYDPDGATGATLTYKWEIDGTAEESSATYAYVDGTKSTDAQPKVKFTTVGEHAVTLTVTDPNGFGDNSPQVGDPSEKQIMIDSVLDIAWDPTESPSSILSATLGGTPQAPVKLSLLSETGTSYEIDFGDGEKENGDLANGKVTIDHNYTKAGTFIVNASVFDAEDNTNKIRRKIYVGSSTTPVAVIGIKVNGEDVILQPDENLTVNRRDVVAFDAGQSKNTDGTGRRLLYSWDIGDGVKSANKSLTHTYKNVGTYPIKLSAKNESDVSQTADDTASIEVVGEPPTMRSVTVVPVSTSLTTPVTVQLNAIGASDPDGRIVRYRWWYYESGNTENEYGAQITTGPTATMIIGTRGDEGQQKTYTFAVEITDDENNSVKSTDLLAETAWPTLTVTNGPNKAPVAKFNVDRTTIFVNESVNFASSSTDPDGSITAYYWDWEGNGFADNTTNEGPSVSHTFTKPAKDGIRIRLKVVDNNESESISDPVTIYVDSKAKPPVAAFTSAQQGTTKTVKFTDNSTADTDNGSTIAKYSWDFDTNVDSNGDGKKDNDTDSTEKDPSHDYPDYTYYRAKLTVTDSEGTTGSVTNFVTLKAPAAPAGTQQTTQPGTQPSAPALALDARLLTTPAASFLDGKIHLTGATGTVTFDFSTSVGDIKKYVIDKNILFDTNGNGVKDDDEDFVATKPGKWTTTFSKAYGPVRVRLTVIDSKGKKDTVDKDIVFDTVAGSLFSADVFAAANSTAGTAALIVSAAGFAILYTKRKINKQK